MAILNGRGGIEDEDFVAIDGRVYDERNNAAVLLSVEPAFFDLVDGRGQSVSRLPDGFDD